MLAHEVTHVPVLIKETLEMLNVKANGIYVDATVGLGGHAEAVLSMLGSEGRLIGIDRDENAIRYTRQRLGNRRVFLENGSFSQIGDILSSINIKEVDGVLFDLGVSMLQLKDMERGFSFSSDAWLDMRMNTSQELTAWDVVNKYNEKDIERILKDYAEEPFARRIARAIIASRKVSPINTCKELSDIVMKVYGGRGKIHPATRTFQALRIEVNRELDELRKGLASALNILRVGGRLCVISYHSLEDRIVKNFIRDSAKSGIMRILTKKPITTSLNEVKANPSSRSAKLRGAERI
ncbi:16S rRNA (cytosine(1402)-N(4))-methyltransferase RsmH [Dissulfurispira thermophila]|nr:16S rRNA (cytosine(1402)-N(4))-methyltransferase RsmH [Dissulfurispira thermophila]